MPRSGVRERGFLPDRGKPFGQGRVAQTANLPGMKGGEIGAGMSRPQPGRARRARNSAARPRRRAPRADRRDERAIVPSSTRRSRGRQRAASPRTATAFSSVREPAVRRSTAGRWPALDQGAKCRFACLEIGLLVERQPPHFLEGASIPEKHVQLAQLCASAGSAVSSWPGNVPSSGFRAFRSRPGRRPGRRPPGTGTRRAGRQRPPATHSTGPDGRRCPRRTFWRSFGPRRVAGLGAPGRRGARIGSATGIDPSRSGPAGYVRGVFCV